MPSIIAILGWSVGIYVPEVDRQMSLGYTHIRVYSAATETGAATLKTTTALVAGQYDYTHNQTDGLATDWVEWCLYSAGLGESTRSERVPVGPAQVTRKAIRQGVGRRLRLLDIHLVTTPSSGAIATFSTLVDPDASVHSYGNRFARVVAGTASGQTRRVRAGASGYSNTSTGQITLASATSPAWVGGDEVEFWVAKGDQDPSAQIDEAINRGRHMLWWDDTYYITTDSQVSEYAAPPTMREGTVKAVEWASGDYPDEPQWRTVPFWDLRNGVISISFESVGKRAPSSNQIIRVLYSRYGDRMDSDTDYWYADLDWSVAQATYDFLFALSSPAGNKEDVGDAIASLKLVELELRQLRRLHMPRPVAVTIPPR